MSDEIKYEILDSDYHQEGQYIPCSKAEVTSNGWLHYELSDGTIGLKRPNTWRVKVQHGKT